MTDDQIRKTANNFWWFMIGIGIAMVIIGFLLP